MDDEAGDPDWSDRRTERDIAQLVTGGEGSRSRTDPDLVGLDRRDTGLSAEEGALHEVDPADTMD